MKKVLYISNIEVPYRNEYFNQLSKKVELTVLYERKQSSNRDKKWALSVESQYSIEYLGGLKMLKEYSFSLKILKHVFSKKYDSIIIGCFNSPSQILAIMFMRLFKKKYILNLDGEYFFEGNSIKKKLKRFLIKGANYYLVAGEKASENLSKIVPKEKIYPYRFSSLTIGEIEKNAKHMNLNINDKVLVVGQYYDYKGLDIALDCAKLDAKIQYKFIGSGKKSSLLEKKVQEMNLNNVEIIPFLQKKELYKEYQECAMLLLPSRQECWGLVINEAASFGCPIVATKGSGAAVELISSDYLINNISPEKMLRKIYKIKNINKEIETYKKYLLKTSKNYSIEKSIEDTLTVLNKKE